MTRRKEIIDPCAAEVMEYWSSRRTYKRFIYFIQEGDEGAIKIGVADNPFKRLAEVQCGNPRDLRIAVVILAGLDTETLLHNHWRPLAGIRGEWFGRGHQSAILAAAARIAAAQIDAYERDQTLPFITDGVFLRALFARQEVVA
jgi:hypothetical protein